jgi:TP901 family phage tail tape measure protein
LNTFHLKAQQAGDVANYLANAANISSADVSDLAESLKYVAPVAASAGVSIKQTNAVLAELANAGIKGSAAGTSLRTFLLSLQAPAAQAAKV